MKFYILISIITLLSCDIFAKNLPYSQAKKIDQGFHNLIRGMDLYYQNRKIDKNILDISFYRSRINNAESPDYAYESILRINDHYFRLIVGFDQEFTVLDFVGNDGINEVHMNTGCVSDGGCGISEEFIIRVFGAEGFTITKIGSFLNYINKANFISFCIEDSMATKEYDDYKGDPYIRRNNKEIMALINKGFYIWIKDGLSPKYKCYRRLFTFELYGRGIRYGTWYKYYPTYPGARC